MVRLHSESFTWRSGSYGQLFLLGQVHVSFCLLLFGRAAAEEGFLLLFRPIRHPTQYYIKIKSIILCQSPMQLSRPQTFTALASQSTFFEFQNAGLIVIIQSIREMSLFSWLLQEKKEDSSPKFVPKINISTKSTLHIEVEPKDPTNCSNIVITAFASQQVRSIVPIRVEWSRFKLKSETMHTVQKIHCLIGNTYMCEPGDVGAYIKAVVRSVDETVRGEAEVTIGPIGIDVMMKRLIQGALYSGSLLSQVTVCEKDRKNNVSLRLNTKAMQFTDQNSGEKLVKDYTMSEPKIELNPKDATRVYLRFEQDQTNAVRQWLNVIYNVRNASIDESSMSIKVPYGHSSSSSKLRLFKKEESHCINKMQLRFISRNSRDLFLFTQRAFICRQDMKNNIYLQRIETLQTISTEDDYYRFLGFISLKNEIIRLADLAQELENDRNAKVKDLNQLEESIADMALHYLQIIEDKSKKQNIDLEQSYSQISLTREEIMHRKNLRELKAENQNLKQRLREMNEEIELLKFFKKEDNESMIFNQTSNPFAKKNANQLSVSYQINAVSPEDNKAQRKNMYEMSMNYTKVLEENNELKRQLMSNNKRVERGMNKLDKSKNMMELLGDLEEKQESQIKHMEYEKKITILLAENEDLKKRMDELISNTGRNRGLSVTGNRSISIIERSMVNQSVLSAASSVADSSMNHSITSEAAMIKLQENLRSLSEMNTKLQQDNTRLRRERDYYRNQASKLNTKIKEAEGSTKNKQDRSNYFNDNSVVYRYREQNEALQNEKKALLRKLESLSKENASGIREQFLQKQKKIKEYEQTIDRLKLENIAMSQQLKEGSGKSEELQFFTNENIKLKKINSELLEQIKSLKIELQINKDNLYNSRIIQMENQLKAVKSDPSNELTIDSKKLLEQINELTKANTKLKQQNLDKQAKLDHQTITIEKLMKESSSLEHSASHKKHNSSSLSTKEKAYSQKCNQATVEELEKYKREIKKLQQEIIFMKKSSDAINRSRDLTLQMDGYYQQKMEIMKKELEALYVQNQNLSKMCERYGKDAREANKELNQWRSKAMELMRAKTEESSIISSS